MDSICIPPTKEKGNERREGWRKRGRERERESE
jgi:hypothetical protein